MSPAAEASAQRKRLRSTLLWIALPTLLVWALVWLLARNNGHRIHGKLHNAGTGEDAWSATPVSCALDPQDGRPPGRSSTRLSLLWLDTSLEDPQRNQHWAAMPDQPLRLDMVELHDRSGGASPLEGVLRTVKHDGPTLLDAGVCRQLELRTAATRSSAAASGTLELDCETLHGHLTGHIRFNRCGR